MANIVLISCNIVEEPYPVYPLGMSMVAEALRSKGHKVLELDLLFEDKSFEKIIAKTKNFFPDIIGLSIRNIDDTDSTTQVSFIDTYKEIVEKIKQNFKTPLVLGGAGFSLFPEVLIEELEADYGIVGEGEKAFCELADKIYARQFPSTKIFSSSEAMTAKEIKITERAPDLAGYYLSEGGMLNIQTKRGCPHKCIYCSYPILEGCHYRFREPSEVVDEISFLIKKYKMDYFSITDSVFNDKQGHYLKIAEELVRRNIYVPYMAFMRPQNFSLEEVILLKRSGLSSVEWGTDASTNTTLEGMQKDFTWSEVVHSTNIFCKSGIANAHFIIFGGPRETPQTLQEGLNNIENLNSVVIFVFTGIRILPNTPIQAHAIKENIISSNDNLLKPKYYFSPETSDSLLYEKITKSFNNRIDRIYPANKGEDKIRAFHRLGYRGPIWDMLLSKKGTRKRD